MEEIWKPVVGFERKYEVSNLGRVRSLDRIIVRGNKKIKQPLKGKIMKTQISSYGYPVVNLYKNEVKPRPYFIHRLMAESFLTDFNKELYVDHIDQNTKNNNLSNLRMCTQSQNVANSGKHRKRRVKGVYKTLQNTWYTRIMFNYKDIYLGTYKTKKEAYDVYNKKAKELFGDFAFNNKLIE